MCSRIHEVSRVSFSLRFLAKNLILFCNSPNISFENRQVLRFDIFPVFSKFYPSSFIMCLHLWLSFLIPICATCASLALSPPPSK